MRALLAASGVLLLSGCAGPSVLQRPDIDATPQPAAEPTPLGPRTLVRDPAALDQLMNNAGVTLQWISWKERGTAYVREENGTVRLTASQAEAGGPGRLMLDGRVAEIGTGYFVFDGRIAISGTPDRGRDCMAERSDWRFAVTQDRSYWRLREFEWCDGLTDYIDIYFPGTRA